MARSGATLDPATLRQCGSIEAAESSFRREPGTWFLHPVLPQVISCAR